MLPIYSMMAANQAVSALLLDTSINPNRLRLWGGGYADESLVGPNPIRKPYVVFQILDDSPEHGITCQNLNASVIYQFDVYAPKESKASEISRALQSALAIHGFTQTVRHPVFEPDVKLYRAGFDLSYISLEK